MVKRNNVTSLDIRLSRILQNAHWIRHHPGDFRQTDEMLYGRHQFEWLIELPAIFLVEEHSSASQNCLAWTPSTT